MGDVRHYHNYINGQFLPAQSGETMVTRSPGDNSDLAVFPRSGQADVDHAVQAAQAAFDTEWSKVHSAPDRSKLLRNLAQTLRDNINDLAELESLDTGKTITETQLIDVLQAADTFEFYADLAGHIQGEVIPVPGDVVNLALREPLGVCGAIAAWNFPLMFLAWKTAPALATGNTVVYKPSELAPSTTLEVARYMHEVGFPKGTINIVGGALEVGQALAEHPDLAKISFTGSVETGRKVASAAGLTPKRVTLELGGKSPNIVFADCHLDNAVSGALNAMFLNAGQVCLAGSRLYIEDSIYDEFLERYISRVAKIKVGLPLDWDARMGALITPEHKRRVQGFVDRAVQAGAKLLVGGKTPDDPELSRGNYLLPTVFADVPPEADVGCNEVFGPVLSVFRFSGEEEAIRLANDTSYGLASAIWTENGSKALRVAKAIQAGTVWINTYLRVNPYSPHGGYKRSGFGRELSHLALEEFTQIKNVYIDHDPAEFLTIFE